MIAGRPERICATFTRSNLVEYFKKMAGTLTEKDVRNIPKCPRHENCCSIKTGTTENETYGKSFFICNNRIKEHCTFSKPAENIQETKCPLHQQMVELKSFAMKADGLRCYYRCIQGKQNNSSWCGSVRLGVKKSGKLKDITNRQDLPSRDNPLKTKREIDISSKNEVPVETVETIVNGLFHIPHSSGSTSSMVNTSDKDHENPEKVSDQQNKKLNFVVVGESDGCTDGVYDMSKTSFHVPRNARISDISETSSHNSSTSSASAIGESELVNEATGYAPSSDTIEIVSSAEEGEEEEEERGGGEGGGEGGGAKKSDFVDTKIHNNSRNSHGLDVQTLEIQISKQKGLLQRIGPITNDNGEKLKKDIERLTKQLEHAKLEQKKPALVKPNVQPLNLVDHFKSMARVRQDLPSMSSGHKHAINLGYDIPSHTVHDNLAMGSKQLPMFGGRMTDKRLKEVVRMSKEAIEHLHKKFIQNFIPDYKYTYNLVRLRSLDTCPTSTEESEDPKHLKVNLMTHQRQALAWLLWRETQTPSCGILADDMGLGKTLTMISLTLKSKQQDLSRIKEAPKDKGLLFTNSTLIVCPASLIHQWYKEIENRVEKMQLRVCLYHGSNRETRVKKLAGYDIILTTYNIVSIEGKPFIQQQKEKPSKPALSEWIDSSGPAKTECGPVFKLFYRRIILDEGHTIKNYKTNISIGVCSLEAESRWIVTGTPIQNQTMDLYSLIKFLRVSPFDELKFWKHEVDNKTASGRKRMTSIVNSLLLRRTKDQIDAKTGKPLVTLPKRSSVLHKLQLSKSETDVYELVQSFSKNMFTQFLDTRKDASGHSTKEAPKSGDYKMPGEVLGMKVEHALTTLGLRSVNADSASCLLVLVLRLRQCCSHMSLMREALDTDLCKSEGIDVPLDEQLGNLSIDERNVDSQNFRPKELKTTFQSTKVKTLLEKLKELQLESEGKKPIKSVIVSQWTRMLDIIAYHLKHDGFKFDFITGSISAKKRSDIVEKFNSDGDPQVMLVSLKAGGVGLNLIGGSHLFLIDQHWNPSLEDQACDRIYRLGQQNDVVIHRFLCLNTVEERIVQLQEKKKALANSVLYGGKSQKLSLDDLKTIFGITR